MIITCKLRLSLRATCTYYQTIISDLCDFEGMDQYSNVVELLVEYTLFLENTKMTKNKIDPDDPDGLNAQEQKRRRLLGRTIRLWKQKFKSIEYTVQAVHECKLTSR